MDGSNGWSTAKQETGTCNGNSLVCGRLMPQTTVGAGLTPAMTETYWANDRVQELYEVIEYVTEVKKVVKHVLACSKEDAYDRSRNSNVYNSNYFIFSPKEGNMPDVLSKKIKRTINKIV